MRIAIPSEFDRQLYEWRLKTPTWALVTLMLVVAEVAANAMVYIGLPLFGHTMAEVGHLRALFILAPIVIPLPIVPLLAVPIARNSRMMLIKHQELTTTQKALELAHRELEWQAMHDPLTDALDRRGFFAVAGRLPAGSTLLAIDLDDLKPINDTFGHAAGDRALKTLADTLAMVCPDIATVARLSGDEFVVLLPEGQEVAVDVIVTALSSMRLPHEAHADTVMSASVGMHVLDEETPVDAALRIADQRLYSAKRRVDRSSSARPLDLPQ